MLEDSSSMICNNGLMEFLSKENDQVKYLFRATPKAREGSKIVKFVNNIVPRGNRRGYLPFSSVMWIEQLTLT